ncbi:MAG: hypothetical protein K0S45_3469 [Nitrospira sp.]|nr:hypothetical protein [Nitrospira sp.]
MRDQTKANFLAGCEVVGLWDLPYMSSRMRKKSASGVLASFRAHRTAMGKEPVPAGSGWAGKNVTIRLFARCGLAWDKARLGAPRSGRVRRLPFCASCGVF